MHASCIPHTRHERTNGRREYAKVSEYPRSNAYERLTLIPVFLYPRIHSFIRNENKTHPRIPRRSPGRSRR